MDRKVIIFLALFILIASGIYFIISTKTKVQDKNSMENLQNDNKMQPSSDNVYPLGTPTDIWESALSNFDGHAKKNYEELIEGLRTGEIVFTWEIWALRRNCPPDFIPSQCDATLLAFIDKNYDSPEKETLKDLIESYLKYEKEVRNLQVPENATFTERYDLIKNKRRELLGREKSELLFGLEESQISFIEATQNYYTSSKNLPPIERVQKYNDLKKKTYGGYLQAVEKREDLYDNYRVELELREKEFEGLKPEDKEKKLYALELRYFGKEKADLLVKERKAENEYTAQIDRYKKIEEDFLKSNAGLKPDDKAKKLKELRVKHLGEEEAERYQNRTQFEEETRDL